MHKQAFLTYLYKYVKHFVIAFVQHQFYSISMSEPGTYTAHVYLMSTG